MGAPCGTLRRCRRLCRKQPVLHGPHLPPFRLQLGPVSFGNISLKRSPTPGFPEILKEKELEPKGREMKCGPDFYHVLQNSLNTLPLWVGLRASVAALDSVQAPQEVTNRAVLRPAGERPGAHSKDTDAVRLRTPAPQFPLQPGPQ